VRTILTGLTRKDIEPVKKSLADSLYRQIPAGEGSRPGGGLVLSGTSLFGTTAAGGGFNAGVLFNLSLGPSLRVARPGIDTVIIAWPYPSEGFALQQNANLGTTDWISVTILPIQIGDEWQVSLSPPPGHRFYRLQKP